MRWNGVEAWNNESFWLHHDDAALSTTRLVDLLLVIKRSYSDKKVFLDCKFGGVRLELRDRVARHLLATVETFNLTQSNVVIAGPVQGLVCKRCESTGTVWFKDRTRRINTC